MRPPKMPMPCTRRSVFGALSVALVITLLLLSNRPAYAATILLNNQASCEALGGEYL